MDVRSVTHERPQVRYLAAIEVHKMQFLKGRMDGEGVERTAGNQFACRLELVDAGAREGIDVDVLKGVLRKNPRIRARVVTHDFQLHLRPITNLVELQACRTHLAYFSPNRRES